MPPDPASAAQLEALMPLAGTLGIRFTAAEPDRVEATMDWAAERCTAGGVLHGGALMALADSAGAACAHLNLPPDAAGTTTVTSTTSFLRAVTDGTVTAVARPVKRGSSVIFVDVEVVDAGGRAVVRTSQTQLVLQVPQR